MNDTIAKQLSKETSDFLLSLSRGKYDQELALADSALAKISLAFPWAITARKSASSLQSRPQTYSPDSGKRCTGAASNDAATSIG